MDNVLVSGIGKSGTTALYDLIKRGARATDVDVACLFEPATPASLAALRHHQPDRPMLTKVMVNRLEESRVRYEDFPHRLMLVRDPRDVVISRLLFRPLTRGAIAEVTPEQLEPFVAALEQKERDPGSISVGELSRLANELEIGSGSEEALARRLEGKRELIDAHGFRVVRYEDLVDDRLDDLAEELGVPLVDPSKGTGGWLSHISRSKGYGAWRQWFLDEDVAYYDGLFADYLQAFDYPRGEPPPEQQHIDPETSSVYIRTRVEARRREVAVRHQEPPKPQDLDDEELEALIGMADDGDPVAARRAADALAVRGEVERATRLAREAAVRGDLPGMRRLAKLLRRAGGDDAVRDAEAWEREARWIEVYYQDMRALRRRIRRLERRAGTAGGGGRSTRSATTRRLRRLRRELAGLLPGRRGGR